MALDWTPPAPISAKNDPAARAVDPGADAAEDAALSPLRPRTLGDYVGQTDLKKNLRTTIDAARTRDEPLEHLLFHGPPGLGKTTLAHILATEMGGNLRATTGPALEKAADLAALLTNLAPGDTLFIDEIHRLRAPIEEILYSALEDGVLDLVLGKGPAARTMRMALSPFTLIGATTKLSAVSAPLRDRFGQVLRLDFYSENEIAEIVAGSARRLDFEISPGGVGEIARRARGVPRIANRLLRRVRDFSTVHGGSFSSESGVASRSRANGPPRSALLGSDEKSAAGAEKNFSKNSAPCDARTAAAALDALGIDPRGLDDHDRRILGAIVENFAGGPVGLGTLAAAVSEEEDTVETVYEPFLLKLGLLARTPRGRVATPAAWEILGKTPPAEPPAGLFG